jgi:hypothetical protein
MTEHIFDRPILNSPYAYLARHWELDASGQQTNRVPETCRRSRLLFVLNSFMLRCRTGYVSDWEGLQDQSSRELTR